MAAEYDDIIACMLLKYLHCHGHGMMLGRMLVAVTLSWIQEAFKLMCLCRPSEVNAIIKKFLSKSSRPLTSSKQAQGTHIDW